MTWAIEEKSYSQRRACELVGMSPRIYRYRSRRPDDIELRLRARKLWLEPMSNLHYSQYVANSGGALCPRTLKVMAIRVLAGVDY